MRSRKFRTLLAVLAVLLPGRLRRFVHVRLLGYDIDPTAWVGRSIIDVDHCRIGPRVHLGHLNVVRGCERFEMGEEAVLDQLNWVNAVRRGKGFYEGIEREPGLVLEKMARIQSMHFVDCSAMVHMEERASLSGFWSLVMTHSFDFREARQGVIPIRIGTRSVISSRSTLLPGAVVPDRSIVAAGSVVTGALDGPSQMFGGVPAKPLRPLDPTSKFFTREVNSLY